MEEAAPPPQQGEERRLPPPPPMEEEGDSVSASGESEGEVDTEDEDGYPSDLEEQNSLFEAIREHEPLSVLQSIVKQRPESVRERYWEELPLDSAVRVGSPVAQVKFLYESFPDAIKDANWQLRLPLHRISDKTPVETVEFLVDKYPEALLFRDGQDDLPIHCAVRAGRSLDVLNVLVERSPESMLKPGNIGYCPIHLAVTVARNPRQVELVQYLTQQCPASLLQRTSYNLTSWAARADEWDEEDGYPRSRFYYEEYEDGLLPIHLAATEKGKGPHQLDVIRFLAEACPSSLSIATMRGNLPVHCALKSDVMPGVVQLFVGRWPESIPEKTKLGLLHYLVRFAEESDCRMVRFDVSGKPWKPCKKFRLENVAALTEALEALPDSLRARDSEGSLPIHVATHLSFGPVVQHLAELDPDSLLVPNANGDLPLHIAIDSKYGQNNTDYFLKCRPQAVLVTRGDGNLAIHDAIERRLFDLVRLMVRLVPEASGSVGAAGRTPLHVAVALPRLKDQVFHGRGTAPADLPVIVDLLLKNSPGSLFVPDLNGALPLHVAIARSSEADWALELVETLLEHAPQSVRTAGSGGNLPLHLAVSKSAPSLPLARLLVKRWSESLEKKDAEGNVPLVLAASNKTASLDLVYWLMRAKPDSVALQQERRGKKRCRGSLSSLFWMPAAHQMLAERRANMPGIGDAFSASDWNATLSRGEVSPKTVAPAIRERSLISALVSGPLQNAAQRPSNIHGGTLSACSSDATSRRGDPKPKTAVPASGPEPED